jgi:hypothetical protein
MPCRVISILSGSDIADTPASFQQNPGSGEGFVRTAALGDFDAIGAFSVIEHFHELMVLSRGEFDQNARDMTPEARPANIPTC